MSGGVRTGEASLLLLGTIVGIGVFGIPYVFLRAGFWTGLAELAVLALAVTIVHLAYARVVASTPTVHRLPGYAARYLGRPFGVASTASYLFGLSGSLLAYVVLGGSFLAVLIQSVAPSAPAAAGPLLFYIVGIAVIFRNIRFEGAINGVFTLGLVAAILLLVGALLPLADRAAFQGFSFSRAAIPYGVLLFALSGAAVIPDLRRVLGKANGRTLERAVITGTLSAAALYALFAVAVVGASGDATSVDAISGLAARFGRPLLILGSAVGFLAAITSFIPLGVVLEGMFSSDLGVRAGLSSILVAAIPLLGYAFGADDYLAIIGLIGAVGIGFDSIMTLLVYRALPVGVRAPRWRIPGPVLWLLVLVFAFGALEAIVRSGFGTR